MRCHACQTEVSIPSGGGVGFRDECDACRTDLHVCLNCAHYDPGAYNHCREPGAERVLDAARANRCDWFRPGGVGTDAEAASERDAALSELERLFSGGGRSND